MYAWARLAQQRTPAGHACQARRIGACNKNTFLDRVTRLRRHGHSNGAIEGLGSDGLVEPRREVEQRGQVRARLHLLGVAATYEQSGAGQTFETKLAVAAPQPCPLAEANDEHACATSAAVAKSTLRGWARMYSATLRYLRVTRGSSACIRSCTLAAGAVSPVFAAVNAVCQPSPVYNRVDNRATPIPRRTSRRGARPRSWRS